MPWSPLLPAFWCSLVFCLLLLLVDEDLILWQFAWNMSEVTQPSEDSNEPFLQRLNAQEASQVQMICHLHTLSSCLDQGQAFLVAAPEPLAPLLLSPAQLSIYLWLPPYTCCCCHIYLEIPRPVTVLWISATFILNCSHRTSLETVLK